MRAGVSLKFGQTRHRDFSHIVGATTLRAAAQNRRDFTHLEIGIGLRAEFFALPFAQTLRRPLPRKRGSAPEIALRTRFRS